ncbi:hypothetical protein OG978_02340 [Streptomyces sp. NBC_01591]|uniref:hypothetical protein n=1 Tax=Streptomyces sp. NBC_01591 TaxID=2975888 RepID=UPI002DD7A2F9|nr:hypothetical protein [Streptomyces sp. NBC_01591]WSD66349.1 hypothetical protein OG978_02340 [Streptomyces sp. NBC_01591]
MAPIVSPTTDSPGEGVRDSTDPGHRWFRDHLTATVLDPSGTVDEGSQGSAGL